MAEERTEQATPRRREEARKRGEVPRSAELAGAGALLGALLGLRFGWAAAIAQARDSTLWFLRASPTWDPTLQAATQVIQTAFFGALSIALPLVAGACLAALAVNLGQTRFIISAQPLAFKWSRLSLAQGLMRIFSRQGVFSVLRSLVKLALILAVTFFFLRNRCDAVLGLAHGTALTAAAGLGRLLWGLLLRIAGVLALVAVADYLFQRREHEKKLRMTRHEQREEHKQTEGDPLTRSRIREQQRALSRHRMIDAVKHAAVVVTNPVEIAVALRYQAAKTPAPIVVAKGRRLLAERIKAEALKHGVPVTPSPDLARALYRSVPIGRQIPPDLYHAVAEILAFVYRLTGRPLR
ncbi:MAG TPA: EscU/YscU/HrcU family type III secretion system export apparatus switch protein [Armatimonadota bacterium]|nr:EscU/YscU/HrcU family type III secretion system export apparatus switch protein [Armatimonadota bacterium]